MTVFSNYTDLENVNNSVVSPAVQRAIESVTGNYDIYDILGDKRTEVYEMIDKALKEKFESYDLEFVSFTITDQDAGDEIEAAIKNESVKQKGNRYKLSRNRRRLRLKPIPRKFKLKPKQTQASSKQKVKPRPTKLSQINHR